MYGVLLFLYSNLLSIIEKWQLYVNILTYIFMNSGKPSVLQVFAIEFVAFAIEFVPFAIEFVGIALLNSSRLQLNSSVLQLN